MPEPRQYFGTDGIRGKVGGELINPEFVHKLGWAAGKVLAADGSKSVVIGMDTRESGAQLASALQTGLAAAGLRVLSAGIIPTPAVAYLARVLDACAGVVISASHNPFTDNGIKFFDRYGGKLSDETERAIEANIAQADTEKDLSQSRPVDIQSVDDAAARYIEFCRASVPADLSLAGVRLVVDCANGAAYDIAPALFAGLDADARFIGVSPDGVNINLECGATNLKALQRAVLAAKADLGIALDGDADRIMLVDSSGNIVDGDEILYIITRLRLSLGEIEGPVVGTSMSNLGLEKAIAAAGLRFIREQVGDRHILQRLHEEGGVLGGEPSGHIICLDRSSTGDGLISALQVLQAMQRENKSLAELGAGMQKFPQVMLNVPVAAILCADQLDAAAPLVAKAEHRLGGNGRVLLRPSGTEALVRVMVEGEDEQLIREIAGQLADAVARLLQNS